MSLKPFQAKLKKRALAALRVNRSVVLQLPTAAGKTVIASDIIKSSRGPIWFICHRSEIAAQAVTRLAVDGVKAGIISASEPYTDRRVQVACVDSLPRRLHLYPAPSMIIWDECHRTVAPKWRKIKDAFPEAKHLGLTATPERLDGKGLNQCFDDIVCGPSIAWLIENEHLSRFRYFAPSEPDLTAAKMQAGDYKKADIAKAMNKPVLIGSAIDEYKKHVPGKRALLFAPSIEFSQNIVAKFRAAGVNAAHVDGTTPADERARAVADLAAGKIKVLSNVEVFTEGFDLPAIDAVILMRPTKSLRLFLQMIGRGLRTAPGKKAVTLFDHAGLWLDHGQPDADWEWSLGGDARDRRIAALRASGERQRRCPECSRVHAVSPVCVECGFEYPAGRELGEFDGRLNELRNMLPHGCCTVTSFATRLGVVHTTVTNWIDDGMPAVGRFPIEKRALQWVENGKKLGLARKLKGSGLSGHVSCTDFGKLIGVTNSTALSLVRRGMPADECGWPHVEKSVEWLKQNPLRLVAPFDVENRAEYMQPRKFEDRHKMKRGSVYALAKRGLPVASNGWVHVPSGDEWLKAEDDGRDVVSCQAFGEMHGVAPHVVLRWKKQGMPSKQSTGRVYLAEANNWVKQNIEFIDDADPDYIGTSLFAPLAGCTAAGVKGLIKSGLPYVSGKGVHVSRAIAWLKKRNSRKLPPQGQGHFDEWENKAAFTRRLSVDENRAYDWKKRGIPMSSNGWVHIQRGLEWVRDNTSIAIPKSAWPKTVARKAREGKPDPGSAYV